MRHMPVRVLFKPGRKRCACGCDRVPCPDSVRPAPTRRLLDTFAHHLGATTPQTDPRLGTLTERERETLVAIGHGWTNGEIAERLSLSESTVKTHVGRVLAKIGARDRVQAVIFAYDLGLTRPQSPR